MRCTTPQQRGKLRQVVAHFHNRPAVPPLPGSVPAAAPREPEDREAAAAGRHFWLRSQGCLFTYNSSDFGEHMWADFLAWIGTLEFLRRWSATMEQSLKSEEPGRVHLHVFMEFGQAVDWTSLRCVVFMGVRPDAAPCTARGPRLRQALDHGHFYVYANKVGTLRVETSGYIPWEDYPVKGWWLDNLWTEHKLSHDVYLEYSCLGC